MINQRMYELGSEPSAIRELFAYGQARKAEIGEDNVFDFSIGNPSLVWIRWRIASIACPRNIALGPA